MHNILKIFFKTAAVIIISMFVLFFLARLIISIPGVQNRLKDETTTFLHQKLNADVSIEKIDINFPTQLGVDKLLVSENENDTLVYLGNFSVAVRIIPLFQHRVVLNEISVENSKGDFGRLINKIPGQESAKKGNDEEIESTPWDIEISAISFDDCYFKYRDNSEGGFELILDFGKAIAKMGTIRPDTLIQLRSLETHNSYVSYKELSSIETEDDSVSSFADIRVAYAKLQNTGFSYIDSLGAVIVNIKGADVISDDLLIDITNGNVTVKNFATDQLFVELQLLPEEKALPETKDFLNWGRSLSDWRFEGGKFKIEDSRVKIDFIGEPDPGDRFDSNHLDFNKLNGVLNNFTLAENILNVEMKQFSTTEMNGLDVLQLDAILQTTPNEFLIPNLKLKTSAADYNIQLQTTLSPTNYSDIKGKTINLGLDLDGNVWQDINYFNPFLKSTSLFSADFIRNSLHLKTKITGKTEDLKIEQFEVNYLKESEISASGTINNLTSPDSAAYSLNLHKLFVSKGDFEKTFHPFFPDSVFAFPGYLELEGFSEGTFEDINFSGLLSSDIGSVNFKRIYAAINDNQSFEAAVSADLDSLHKLTGYDIEKAKFRLEGSFSGKDIYNSLAHLNLSVDTLTFFGHVYKNAEANGVLDAGQLDVNMVSQDSSALVNAELNATLSESNKKASLALNVENLDLKELNIVENKIDVQSKAAVSLDYSSDYDFKGALQLQKLDFYFADTVYRMNPIDLDISSNQENTKLTLASFFYQLDYMNEGTWHEMLTGVKKLPAFYSQRFEKDTANHLLPDFELKGYLDYPEEFARLVFPGLPSFNSLSLAGSYSKTSDDINFSIEMPGIQNENFYSDSLMFLLWGNSNELHFKGISYFNLNQALKGNIDIRGDIRDSKLNLVTQYFDSYSERYMSLNTLINADSNNVYLQVVPDSLIFSYDPWQINPLNKVTFKKGSIGFSNFNLGSDEQNISIQTGNDNKTAYIDLLLHDFGMGSIENLMALDTLVKGTANAAFRFKNIATQPEIEGSLKIDGFSISDFDFGELNISELSYAANKLNYKLSLLGEKQNVQSVGLLDFTQGHESMDVNFAIKKFDFSELSYLLKDKISDPRGKLEAGITINGTINDPRVNGSIKFTDAGMGLNMLNEYFWIGNQTITLKENTIYFDNLSVSNEKGRTAKLNGTFSYNKETGGMQDLTFTTDNMELLNTSEAENELIFGLLKAQTSMNVTGSLEHLIVDAKTKIDKNTSLNYVFLDALRLHDSRGIVTFGRYSPDSAMINQFATQDKKLKSMSIENLKANVEIEPGARFKIFFDQSKTDFLDVALDGNVSYVLDGDNSDVSGVFSIVEGKLKYSLPMVSVNDYTIEPGSYLTISNDIYNPYLNIVASTTVRASAEKLIEDYTRVMDFTVLLRMSGELNNMKIEFDISPETEDVLVSSKLSQLSAEERNINALNLLVRGSFTITVKSDEVGSTSMSESLLDRFYTEQLNHLISENIQFVDVSFDVQSFTDFGTYGESVIRRNYYYNLGKSFLNDRARISYKGSMNFTSDEERQNLNSQFVQNELELEYNLTGDGGLKAIFFNRNRYEGILEGKVIETGGGLKLHKEYYNFGDIFKRTKQTKEKKN